MTLTMNLKLPIPSKNVKPLKALKGPASPLTELVDEEGRSRVEYALGLGLPCSRPAASTSRRDRSST